MNPDAPAPDHPIATANTAPVRSFSTTPDTHGAAGLEVPVREHLAALVAIGERPTGSPSSRRAEAYIERALGGAGCRVERQAFPCTDWRVERASFRCGDDDLPVVANPYSPPCDIRSGVAPAGTTEELGALDAAGRIVVLHGELTAAPWMPKEFPFYTDEEARARALLVESKRPAAVVAVSPRTDHAVPVIIDGEFPIPSCTVTAETGALLLSHPDTVVELVLETAAEPARAANVIGRLGGDGPRLVLTAHLDTKHHTPGALDNATGLAVMLALADHLAADPPCALEFVAFNGEEHHGAPGELAYIAAGRLDPGAIGLAINLDGIGLGGCPASLALFSCPPALEAVAREILAASPDLVRVDPWPAGDHMIFCMQGVPSMAVSSATSAGVIEAVIHTPTDTLDRVDALLVARTASAIEALVRGAARSLGLSAPGSS